MPSRAMGQSTGTSAEMFSVLENAPSVLVNAPSTLVEAVPNAPVAQAVANPADTAANAPKSDSTVSAEAANQAAGTPNASGQIVAKARDWKNYQEVLGEDIVSPEQRAKLQENLERYANVLRAQENVVKTVVKLITPSVVHIETRYPHPQFPNNFLSDTGSGVIVFRNEKYYVITNRHVVHDAAPSNIRINLFDRRQITPTQVWRDDESDMAILQLNEKNLIPMPIGDSNRVEIGEFVLAVGSPFGLERSVTFGIVSAKGRRTLDVGDAKIRMQDFIQTDAAINPGNSGGPLINLRGELIGINTAIASDSGLSEGVGFSMPVQVVMLITDQLITYGHVRRAFMGLTLDANFTQKRAQALGLPHPIGARVSYVQHNSPASEANFRVDDVVLKFNGMNVEDFNHLYNLVNLAELDKDIPITVYRGGKTYDIQIRLRER